MVFRFIIFTIIFFISTSSYGDRTQKPMNSLNLITENYPPYNYVEKGQLKGLSVDILLFVLKDAGSDLKREDIQIKPWARGYNIIQNKKNTILFAMHKTKKRENLFKWIGPIVNDSSISIFAHKSSKIKINSLKDLQNLKINIAALNKDSGKKVLIDNGFSSARIYTTSSPESLINIFKFKRYQLISYGDLTTKWRLKKSGADLSQYKVLYSFKNLEDYYCVNKNTSDYIVKQLQSALDRFKKTRQYKKIIAKYTK
jgi:polar amino acid transport system substrate-binding protein